jgi:hypothetical protein
LFCLNKEILFSMMIQTVTKVRRVADTGRLARRVLVFTTERERKQAIREKNQRYYAKYKEIGRRKQRMRYAKKKLLHNVEKYSILALGRQVPYKKN